MRHSDNIIAVSNQRTMILPEAAVQTALGERAGVRAYSLQPRREALINRFAKNLLLFFIQLYRLIFSPAQVFLFGANSGCRFTPTCSQYAAEAIRQHGALAGSVLAVRRICRCHPLGGCGHDPVPDVWKGRHC